MDKNQNLWNVNFIFICVVAFLSTLGTSIGTAILSRKAVYLGASAEIVGAINSVASISALICIPLAAPFIDYFNKKYVYALVTLISALTLFGNAVTNTIGFMLALTFINGIGKGISATSSLAIVSDTIPESKMTAGITYFTIFQVASQAFGPSFGLALYDYAGYGTTFLISSVMVFLTVIMIFKIPTPSHKRQSKFKFKIRNAYAKEAISPAVMMVFLSLAYSTVNSFLIVYADSIQIQDIGLYFTVNTIVLLFSRPLVAKLSERIKERTIIVAAVLFTIAALFLISMGTSLIHFIIAAVFAAFGYGSLQPMIQAMCVESVGPDRRGAASSTSYMGTNIGYLLGPTLGGMIAGRFGYSRMFASMNISLIIAILFYFGFVERRKKNEAYR